MTEKTYENSGSLTEIGCEIGEMMGYWEEKEKEYAITLKSVAYCGEYIAAIKILEQLEVLREMLK